MKLKKAMLWGVAVAAISYIVIGALRVSNDIWEPILEIIGLKNTILKWSVACALTLAALAAIGYVIMLSHPFRAIMYKILRIKTRQAKGVVLVEWGSNRFLGWLTGVTQIDEEILYIVLVPSAPLPISGQLMLVPLSNITFINLSIPAHLAILTSMGFGDFPEKLDSSPCPLSNNNQHRGKKSQTAPPG
ncbi:hypothetical protein KJ562_00075 [Patescibacteria group bacterium]|nr:hypothetical protein [Patescibacteria group bacterium]